MTTTDETLQPYPRIFPGPAINAAGVGRNYETTTIHRAWFLSAGLAPSDFEWTPDNVFNVVLFMQDVPIGRPDMVFEYNSPLFFGTTQISGGAAGAGAFIRTSSDRLSWTGSLGASLAPGLITADTAPQRGAPGEFTINAVAGVSGFLAAGTVPNFAWRDAAGGGGAPVLPIAYFSAICEGAVSHGIQNFTVTPGFPNPGDEISTQAIINAADYTEEIRDAGNRITLNFAGADAEAIVVGVYEELLPVP